MSDLIFPSDREDVREVSSPPRDPCVAGGEIVIVIATTGRARTSRQVVQRLGRQSRKPDRVLVVGAEPADIAEVATLEGVETFVAPRGSCSQRNRALDRVDPKTHLVCFFDDDFVPSNDYLEVVETVFAAHPDIVGLNGRLIADGIHGPGLTLDQAETLIALDKASPVDGAPIDRKLALYGCNMIFRWSTVEDLRFDEALPLYGWQEDIDYSTRAGRRGRLIVAQAATGVHLGEKAGRTSGRRFGYSQIANPIYLLGKGSIRPALARRIMWRTFAANLIRSPRPEPWVDRRGRFMGNMLAIADLVRGKLDPRRILEFNQGGDG